jgi:hypothetical protein
MDCRDIAPLRGSIDPLLELVDLLLDLSLVQVCPFIH